MTGAKQFGLGVKTYGQAISFIFRNKLGWTFLVPVGLTILMFIGGQALVNEAIDFLQEEILGWVNLEESGFWGGLLGGVVGLLTEILFFIIFAYISGYIVIILMSPLLAYLSEKTEQILTGSEYSVGISQMIKDIVRGIFMALRNLFMELLLLLLMFLVSFIPVVGWLGTIVVFFISAYFYGFSFIDFNNERQKLNIRQSVKVVRKYKWVAIANGLVFSLFLLIPFCGMFMPLFVSIVSVVAAALAMHKTDAYKQEII
jgi:CysZ protein